MARNGCQFIYLIMICLFVAATGCGFARNSIENASLRGQMFREKVAFHANQREARLQERLALLEERLRESEGPVSTTTETTLAMQVNQSMDFDDIELDVDEMKRVLAMAEARARAEALRRKRLPQLLRDQQKAMEDAGVESTEPVLKPTGVQVSHEADDIVAIDEFGNPLEFLPEPAPCVALSEIPFLMRVHLNIGVDNARVESSSVRQVRSKKPSPIYTHPETTGPCDQKSCGQQSCGLPNCDGVCAADCDDGGAAACDDGCQTGCADAPGTPAPVGKLKAGILNKVSEANARRRFRCLERSN